MKEFFGEDLLLYCDSAKKIYDSVKDLPIIDYHCHLDQNKIASDARFSDIGELWLSGDHYKWRAMRLCGIDEHYITGDASWHDKFVKYAQIMPQLAGNPLYYWTHLELKRVFSINEPLCFESAERIYEAANKKLKSLSVSSLLKQFKVEFVATTDDPCDDLSSHGTFGGTRVAPTFRPDKLYSFDENYIKKLAESADMKIVSLDDLMTALGKLYFASKGCRISDHGFYRFPLGYADETEAAFLFARRNKLNSEEKERLYGFLLVWLAREYRKRDMIMQIHFAVIRNNNSAMFAKTGVDSGFDLPSDPQPVKDIIRFLDALPDSERPLTVLYTLADSNLSAIAAITGAFGNVRMGAAWWFNDTVEGVRRNLTAIAEYAALGSNFGMLTDSRSFSSYVRFEFFRRILSEYLGNLVEKGEYDVDSAKELARNICYYNIKGALIQ